MEKTKKPEDFEVVENVRSLRKKVVRQDRLDTEDLNCQVHVDGQVCKVLNISHFGLALRSEKSLQKIGEVPGAQVFLNQVEIAQAHLQFVRESKGDQGFNVAFEVIGEPISISRFCSVRDSDKLVEQHKATMKRNHQVPKEFRQLVYEIKESLEQLQKDVHEMAVSAKSNEKLDYEDFEYAMVQIVGQHISEILPSRNEELRKMIVGVGPEQLKGCVEFFREKLKSIIYLSPFSSRVFHKPLGYAGDYEMMNIIYKGGNNGSTPFAKCLNYHWVSQPAAQAVRNRIDYLLRLLTKTLKQSDGPLRILSVASGPAKEWQQIIADAKFGEREIEVHLLDQDETALKHAQKRIKSLSFTHKNKLKFTYINKAIKNIIGHGLDDKYDLIYSAGLFDYFSDPVAQLAATRLHEVLKPSGKLVIGNFNVTNPNSIMMDLALDWNLIYRSEQDLTKLYSALHAKMEIEKEELDINLFCVIHKG